MDVQKNQRLANCMAMMQVIEANGSASRKDIADKTGLSLMTVGKMCSILEEGGIIEEAKAEKSECGRRASICSATSALAACVINLADNVYTLTVYTPSGRPAASFIHTSPADSSLDDKLFLFADRMADMLERLSYIPPERVCVVTDLHYSDGIISDSLGNRADLRRAVDKIFKGKPLHVYSVAGCAAAYLEKAGRDESVAAVIGKELSFSLPASGNAPFECLSVFPRGLRVDGVSLDERLKMAGTPDKECVFAFLAAISAFYPNRKIAIFPLAESNGAMTCGEMCRFAVRGADIGERCTSRTDPLGDISEGARVLLLADIIKKHI